MHNLMLTRHLDAETKYKKRFRVAELPYLAPTIERPIAHRCGLFSEIYLMNTLHSAHYSGLRRIPTLSRHFDPARLPN